jgi:cell division protein FtsB
VKQRIITWFKGVASFIRPIHLIAGIGLIVFFWFLIMGDQGLYSLRQLHELRDSLLTKRQRLTDDMEKMAKEKEMLEDPKNLEMIIRQELGYIRPGEVIYQEPETKD